MQTAQSLLFFNFKSNQATSFSLRCSCSDCVRLASSTGPEYPLYLEKCWVVEDILACASLTHSHSVIFCLLEAEQEGIDFTLLILILSSIRHVPEIISPYKGYSAGSPVPTPQSAHTGFGNEQRSDEEQLSEPARWLIAIVQKLKN